MTVSPDNVVAGLYKLGKALHHSHEGAVYETEYGDDARPAVIRLRRGDTSDAESWLNRWRNSLELPHANLIAVYGAGRSTVDDLPVIYVVMERAEQSLADILAERTLSEEETGEMLEPTLSALQYLHGNGYAHANLKPTHILAVGDRLKLSSDTMQSQEEGGKPSDDIWALGIVLVQSLTHQLPELDEDAGPYILRDASEPLTDIVRHCLDPDVDKRWTVAQVAARLNLKAATLPIPPPVKDAVPPIEKAPPIQKEEIRRPVPEPFEESAPPVSRKWIYVALAGIVLVVGAIGLSKKTDRHPAIPAAAAAPTLVAAREKSAPQTEPPAVRDRRSDGWVVVVASYSARDAAEKRAKSMSKRWPRFHLDIFEPTSDKVHHLVILGKNLSEDQAEVLRKRAVTSGMARDAYIKRFL